MPTETQHLEQRVAALQSDLNERDQRTDDLSFQLKDREGSRRDWFVEAQRLERESEELRSDAEKQRRLKLLVAEKLKSALDNCSVYRIQLYERDALLQQGLEMINRGIVSFDDQVEYRQKLAALSASAGLAAQPVPTVPDGYCIMPKRLTAENGAKALLLGEFKLQSSHECPECRELEEPSEGCEICDGEGEYGQNHVLPWDLIKFIYSKAVKGLAVKAEPAKF